MNRRKLIAGIASALVAVAASVFASQGVKSESSSKCYPTGDGRFVCKATGEVMDAPCCDKPCCK